MGLSPGFRGCDYFRDVLRSVVYPKACRRNEGPPVGQFLLSTMLRADISSLDDYLNSCLSVVIASSIAYDLVEIMYGFTILPTSPPDYIG